MTDNSEFNLYAELVKLFERALREGRDFIDVYQDSQDALETAEENVEHSKVE